MFTTRVIINIPPSFFLVLLCRSLAVTRIGPAGVFLATAACPLVVGLAGLGIEELPSNRPVDGEGAEKKGGKGKKGKKGTKGVNVPPALSVVASVKTLVQQVRGRRIVVTYIISWWLPL